MSGRPYRSRRGICFALEEQLEVEKVYQRSQDHEDSGIFDNLYQGVQTEVEVQKAIDDKEAEDNTVEETPPDDSTPTDTDEESPPPDSDKPKDDEEPDPQEPQDKDPPKDDESQDDPKDEASKDEEKGDDQEPQDDGEDTDKALEALLIDHSKAFETFVTVERTYNAKSLYAHETFTESLAGGLKYIGEVGFKYGPVLLKHVYKGVLIALNYTFKALVKSTVFIGRMVKKYMNSYKHHKNHIYELRKVIEVIEHGQLEISDDTSKYTKEAVISRLKAGGSTDLLKLCESVLKFDQAFFKQFEQSASTNIAATDNMIHSAMSKTIKHPQSMMRETFPLAGFKQQSVEGYTKESEYIDNYVYSQILPGDLLFMGYLPKQDLRTRDEIFEAYKDVELFIGLNQTSVKRVESIDYMEIADIKKYLDHLETLCTLGIQQEKILHGIVNKKTALKIKLGAYLKYLATAQSKVSIEDSLAEYISLKIRYFDRTLIHGCDAVHEFTTSYISASLTYIAACLKRYA